MSGRRPRRPAATARPHASAVGTRTAPARPSRPPYLASGLLLVATLLGGVRATSLMAHAGDDPRSLRIAGATWHVTDVEQVVGVAQRDLMSGMGHNISGYVPDDEMLVKVSVVINAGRPSRRLQRRLAAGLRGRLPHPPVARGRFARQR